MSGLMSITGESADKPPMKVGAPITDMFNDPQTIEREMVIEVDNKKAGKSNAIGMPIKFSKSKTEKSKGAPNLGEHTKEVMQIFGYKDDQIEDFYNRKVIL